MTSNKTSANKGYMKMKRTNIYATEQQLAKIKQLAKETGLVMSEIIRRAIDEYLAKMTKE